MIGIILKSPHENNLFMENRVNCKKVLRFYEQDNLQRSLIQHHRRDLICIGVGAIEKQH